MTLATNWGPFWRVRLSLEMSWQCGSDHENLERLWIPLLLPATTQCGSWLPLQAKTTLLCPLLSSSKLWVFPFCSDLRVGINNVWFGADGGAMWRWWAPGGHSVRTEPCWRRARTTSEIYCSGTRREYTATVLTTHIISMSFAGSMLLSMFGLFPFLLLYTIFRILYILLINYYF